VTEDKGHVKARLRGLQGAWPTSTTMMELPISLAIMGGLAAVAAAGYPRLQTHLYALEALSFVGGASAAAMEYHAVHGAWPTSYEQAGYSSEGPLTTGRLRSVEIRDGGAVDVTFSNQAGNLANQILSFRAWQGSASDLPVAWRCGHAQVPTLAASSLDRTTLSDEELPSPCRSKP